LTLFDNRGRYIERSSTRGNMNGPFGFGGRRIFFIYIKCTT